VAEFPAPAQPYDSSFERTPPQDIAAEQCVLGGMLLSKDAIADVVEVLRPGDFYKPAHQTVYDVVLDLYGRGEPADPVTVSAELTRRGELARAGGAPYLHTLISSVPTAANAAYYARIVRERAVLRRLVEAGTKIVQMGYGADGGEADEIVDRAQAELYSVTERRTSEDYLALADIMHGTLEEIEAISSRGGAMVGVPTGFIDLDSLTNGLHGGQLIVVAARPAAGKALALDTPLPTPTGWTTMGEVEVGAQLLGADGRPTTVVAATAVMHGRPCYEVKFSDGTVIVADAQHQWLTATRASRRKPSARPQVCTTEQLAATLRCATADERLNHSVPNTRPLELPRQHLPLPPYALGVWLGDGHSSSARYTSADPEIAMHIEDEGLVVRKQGRGLNYHIGLPITQVEQKFCAVCGIAFLPKTSQVRTCGRSCGGRARKTASVPDPTCPDCGTASSGLRRCDACHREHGTVQAILRTMGLLGNKNIPTEYLRSSDRQRRDLLAGLLDSDGTVAPNGAVQFCVTNRALAMGALELVQSLGYRGALTTRTVRGRSPETSTAYIVSLTTDDVVFRLERKAALHKARTATRRFTRRAARFIVDVWPVPSVPVRCVEVASSDHLYLASRAMIPTHNSTLGLDLCRSASIRHQLTSVIFSLEMGRNEITMRMLSAEARVALHHMRSGTMSDDDWTRLARTMSSVSEAPLFIDDSPNMSMMEIRAKCRRLKQRHDLRLVVVDYLQLMTSGKRVESRQQEVAEFSRSMKLLAKELDVPVVAISQLNRGPEQRTDKRPQLSDLRESGAIEQDADMVILLHREDMYERESPRAGEADLIVAKNRNGPTANVVVAFQGHYARFVDMAPS
jgi:replicative DNA helicase